MGDGRGWDDELLGAAAVARGLGVGLVTVYRWCRQGRLACLKLSKEWRIRRSALDAFLRQAEQPHTRCAQSHQAGAAAHDLQATDGSAPCPAAAPGPGARRRAIGGD